MIKSSMTRQQLLDFIEKRGVYGTIVPPQMVEDALKTGRVVVCDLLDADGTYWQVSVSRMEFVYVHNVAKNTLWVMRIDQLLYLALREGLE